MAEGQADTPQPEVVHGVTEQQLAQQAALRIIASEEPAEAKPEGKTEAQPEAKAEPEAKVEPEGETPQEAKPEELDWEKVKTFKRKFTVKGEGGVDEEVEVPLEELVPGYMRQKDYQRKTSELAKAREAAADEIRKSVEPKAKELDEKLQTYDAVLVATWAQETQGVNLDQLAQENPAEWAKAVQRINNLGAAINRVRTERAELAQRAQTEQKAVLAKSARAAIEELQRDIPGWSNDRYAQVLKAGKDHYGFQPEELNAITDPRAIKVLDDARQFRELKAAKPAVEKRVVDVPKVVKPGTAEKPDASADKWNKGMASLQRSGTTQSAVQLAKILLERSG
jgi:hypothetical protein